jgi:hypothetical protein
MRVLQVYIVKGLLYTLAITPIAFLYINGWRHISYDARTSPRLGAAVPANAAIAASGTGPGSQSVSSALKHASDHSSVRLMPARLNFGVRENPAPNSGTAQTARKEQGSTGAKIDSGRVQFQWGDTPAFPNQAGSILDADPVRSETLYGPDAVYINIGNAQGTGIYWKRVISSDPAPSGAEFAQRALSWLRKPTR